MACCALAVFIIGQLYGLIAAVRERIGLSPSAEQSPGASAWRPGMAVAVVTPAPRPAFALRPAFLIYLASFGALAVAITGFAQISAEARTAHVKAMLADPLHWCGDLAEQLTK